MDKETITKYVAELPDEFDELGKLVPYAKHVLTAYKFIRKKRFVLFLKAINAAEDELGEKERQRFAKYVNSNLGKELLSEYADTVLRTSSLTAIAALGILYADIRDSKYTPDFKRLACLAIQGSTDKLVDVFIALCSVAPESTGGPYPVRSISQDIMGSNNELCRLIGTAEDAFAFVNELIRRGMFLPDHAPSRVGGGKWFVNFGCTDISHSLRDLMLKAKAFLGKEGDNKESDTL